jgi:hypothetical protein
MKYSWKFLLAVQFAAMTFITTFVSPFPYAGLIFAGVTFILNKRILFIELVLELPITLISRQTIMFLALSIWALPRPILARIFADVLIILLYSVTFVLSGIMFASLTARYLRWQLKKKAPDILAMLRK